MTAVAVPPTIIDCDPGVDDAHALFAAIGARHLSGLEAVTVVAGNVALRHTRRNALRIREVAGLDAAALPVYAGCPGPMIGALTDAADVHGADGLDGAGLPEPQGEVEPIHAVAFLIDRLRRAASEGRRVRLVTLGPLTNLATALIMAPDIADGLLEVRAMIGSAGRGNITPAAEFNAYVDPEALERVATTLDAAGADGVPFYVYGLTLTHTVTADRTEIARYATLDSRVGRAVAGMLGAYLDRHRVAPLPGMGGAPADEAPLHDPCVIADLLAPGAVRAVPGRLRVVLHGPARGQTLASFDAGDEVGAGSRVIWMVEGDAGRLRAALFSAVSGFSAVTSF
ncbi:nucleoside hydrolase [Tistrella mobilis]|uniref:Inosine-uridine preferring nucleoside hydrolase family protein n=1 Tax=Tistrella mobilis (strain KA081020-065) TaxID=1110502 RepID=I3TI68_TISMK|nr:nucleoside hydrolase [Tistrella mobilis]AFK52456.1 inosine-uridine preferring nucleoside hydrolase family protein [Tistrella mobilis KA081020-065]